MQDFKYLRPTTAAEARDAFDRLDNGSFLAGGQTLLPVMKQGLAMPSGVVALAGIDELKGIPAAGGAITIGAMATHASVAASPEVRQAIPALAGLAGGIGDPTGASPARPIAWSAPVNAM